MITSVQLTSFYVTEPTLTRRMKNFFTLNMIIYICRFKLYHKL